MVLSQRSIDIVLGLIEDRIGQLDPLIPQDTDDLDTLMHCREEMRVTATEVLAAATPRRSRAQHTSSVSLDVI